MQAGASLFDSLSSQPDDSVTMGPTGGTTGGLPDMSTDNSMGTAGLDSPSTVSLEGIQEGMKVVDANGDDIGKVDYVKLGDPQAATTAGEMGTGTDTILAGATAVLGGDAEPDVPEPFRSELLREGFIKVDGKGWFDTDRYLRASDIAGVSDDSVQLRIAKEAVPGKNM